MPPGQSSHADARRKEPGGRVSVAVVYPGPAREGMASLALHGIYALANRSGRSLCERTFYQTGSRGSPRSLESRRPLNSFDLLAFTVAFEEQWALLPKMLGSAGIPAESRRRHQAHPIVAVGGIAARLNPGPALKFADLIVCGDAECVLPQILDCLDQGRGARREDLFEALGRIVGVAVRPAGGARPVALYQDAGRPVVQTVFDPPSSFNRMILVETGRGCPAGCRFCALAHARRPPVFFPAKAVMEAVRSVAQPGRRVGLVGASLSRHPELIEMMAGLAEYGVDISPASLGTGVLASSGAEALLGHLQRSGQRTVTLAPETGSKRLQKLIGKPLSEPAFEQAVCRLGEAGILHLKLYLLYGLPTEQPEDLSDSVELVARARRCLLQSQRSRGGAGRLTVSINPFVPKPHTPWAGEPMVPLAELRRRRKLLQEGLRRLGGVAVSGFSPRLAVWQCLLDRGGEELFDLLIRVDGRWPPPPGLVDEVVPHWRELVHGRC